MADAAAVDQAPADTTGALQADGVATVYHDSLHGLKTASGEQYDRAAFTAAHRTLPIGTRVLVTNMHNLRQVLVRINDRGPFTPGRILDLSSAAAEKLGMLAPGKLQVQLALQGAEGKPREASAERIAEARRADRWRIRLPEKVAAISDAP